MRQMLERIDGERLRENLRARVTDGSLLILLVTVLVLVASCFHD